MFVKKQYDQALALASQCQSSYRILMDRTGEGNALCLIGEINFATKKTEEGMTAAVNAQKMFQAGADSQGDQAAQELMGRIAGTNDWSDLVDKNGQKTTESKTQVC